MMTMNRLNCDTQLDDERVTKTNAYYAFVALPDVNSKPGLCCSEILVFLEGGTVEMCKASLSRWLFKASPSFLRVQYSHGYFHTTSPLLCQSSPVCVSNNDLGHGERKDEELRDDEQLSPQPIEETDLGLFKCKSDDFYSEIQSLKYT